MLETDEVDDDYFTPVGSTTLANIFGKSTIPKEKLDNETLKYTPPNVTTANQKLEEIRTTSCVFASALTGYEWFNNVYSSKGKLGFAIIKVLKTATHSIILYDSNKTTLSSATITSTLEVTVKGTHYVSYYDDNKKYWSLYGSEEEIKKVLEFLESLGVGIRSSVETDSIPPEPINKDSSLDTPDKSKKHDVESDTDSINKKSKAAILSRMATMGHSVLPLSTLHIDKSSDSSDTNEPPITKIVRHKPIKSVPKKPDKPNEKKNIDTTIHSTEIQNVNTYYDDHQNQQIIPLPSTSIITTTSGTGNDMNLFMTEQRICNSELRINMSRITDKVDHALTKLKDLQTKENNSNNDFNTEILQKLLREYENKIKTYENMLKSGTHNSTAQETNNKDSVEKITVLKNRISDLESIIKDKNDYVLTLKNEIQAVKEANSSQENAQNNNLSRKVLELEQELSLKNKQIIKQTNQLDSKVKAIMNETYQVIANNFESNESYSGDIIKNIVAKVIKKVTTDSLN